MTDHIKIFSASLQGLYSLERDINMFLNSLGSQSYEVQTCATAGTLVVTIIY